MKKTLFIVISVFVFLQKSNAQDKAAATATEAPALGSETICESDIYYYWKLKPLPTPTNSAKKPAEATPTPEMPDNKVLYQTVGEHGETETDVKNKLAAKITASLRDANEDCRNAHQDQTSCLTKKIKSQNELLGKIDFATKNKIISAMTDDCKNELGSCGKIESSEIRCYLNKAIAPKSPNAEAASTKKK